MMFFEIWEKNFPCLLVIIVLNHKISLLLSFIILQTFILLNCGFLDILISC